MRQGSGGDLRNPDARKIEGTGGAVKEKEKKVHKNTSYDVIIITT